VQGGLVGLGARQDGRSYAHEEAAALLLLVVWPCRLQLVMRTAWVDLHAGFGAQNEVVCPRA
jgi:hypothetical protein